MSSSVKSGQIDQWNDEKGFGFIRADDGTRVFFHISDLTTTSRPGMGDAVRFHTISDDTNRVRAKNIEFTALGFNRAASFHADKRRGSARPQESQSRDRVKPSSGRHADRARLPLISLIALLVLPAAGLIKAGSMKIHADFSIGLMGAGVMLLASLIAYCAYAIDKRRAARNEWRIPEVQLQTLALVGGWPGAFIAQQRLRHKTKKLSFRLVFWAIVWLHQLAWLDYLVLGGNGLRYVWNVLAPV